MTDDTSRPYTYSDDDGADDHAPSGDLELLLISPTPALIERLHAAAPNAAIRAHHVARPAAVMRRFHQLPPDVVVFDPQRDIRTAGLLLSAILDRPLGPLVPRLVIQGDIASDADHPLNAPETASDQGATAWLPRDATAEDVLDALEDLAGHTLRPTYASPPAPPPSSSSSSPSSLASPLVSPRVSQPAQLADADTTPRRSPSAPFFGVPRADPMRPHDAPSHDTPYDAPHHAPPYHGSALRSPSAHPAHHPAHSQAPPPPPRLGGAYPRSPALDASPQHFNAPSSSAPPQPIAPAAFAQPGPPQSHHHPYRDAPYAPVTGLQSNLVQPRRRVSDVSHNSPSSSPPPPPPPLTFTPSSGLYRASQAPLSYEAIRVKLRQVRHEDYFNVLELPKSATPDRIAQAHSALLNRYHPKRVAQPISDQYFYELREICEAIDDARLTLSLPDLRDAYIRVILNTG